MSWRCRLRIISLVTPRSLSACQFHISLGKHVVSVIPRLTKEPERRNEGHIRDFEDQSSFPPVDLWLKPALVEGFTERVHAAAMAAEGYETGATLGIPLLVSFLPGKRWRRTGGTHEEGGCGDADADEEDGCHSLEERLMPLLASSADGVLVVRGREMVLRMRLRMMDDVFA